MPYKHPYFGHHNFVCHKKQNINNPLFDLLSSKEKIDVLRRYDSGRFREFLFLMFSPNVEFDVEIPKTYKVNPEPEGMTM
jgi:hypothetical protein